MPNIIDAIKNSILTHAKKTKIKAGQVVSDIETIEVKSSDSSVQVVPSYTGNNLVIDLKTTPASGALQVINTTSTDFEAIETAGNLQANTYYNFTDFGQGTDYQGAIVDENLNWTYISDLSGTTPGELELAGDPWLTYDEDLEEVAARNADYVGNVDTSQIIDFSAPLAVTSDMDAFRFEVQMYPQDSQGVEYKVAVRWIDDYAQLQTTEIGIIKGDDGNTVSKTFDVYKSTITGSSTMRQMQGIYITKEGSGTATRTALWFYAYHGQFGKQLKDNLTFRTDATTGDLLAIDKDGNINYRFNAGSKAWWGTTAQWNAIADKSIYDQWTIHLIDDTVDVWVLNGEDIPDTPDNTDYTRSIVNGVKQWKVASSGTTTNVRLFTGVIDAGSGKIQPNWDSQYATGLVRLWAQDGGDIYTITFKNWNPDGANSGISVSHPDLMKRYNNGGASTVVAVQLPGGVLNYEVVFTGTVPTVIPDGDWFIESSASQNEYTLPQTHYQPSGSGGPSVVVSGFKSNVLKVENELAGYKVYGFSSVGGFSFTEITKGSDLNVYENDGSYAFLIYANEADLPTDLTDFQAVLDFLANDTLALAMKETQSSVDLATNEPMYFSVGVAIDPQTGDTHLTADPILQDREVEVYVDDKVLAHGVAEDTFEGLMSISPFDPSNIMLITGGGTQEVTFQENDSDTDNYVLIDIPNPSPNWSGSSSLGTGITFESTSQGTINAFFEIVYNTDGTINSASLSNMPDGQGGTKTVYIYQNNVSIMEKATWYSVYNGSFLIDMQGASPFNMTEVVNYTVDTIVNAIKQPARIVSDVKSQGLVTTQDELELIDKINEIIDYTSSIEHGGRGTIDTANSYFSASSQIGETKTVPPSDIQSLSIDINGRVFNSIQELPYGVYTLSLDWTVNGSNDFPASYLVKWASTLEFTLLSTSIGYDRSMEVTPITTDILASITFDSSSLDLYKFPENQSDAGSTTIVRIRYEDSSGNPASGIRFFTLRNIEPGVDFGWFSPSDGRPSSAFYNMPFHFARNITVTSSGYATTKVLAGYVRVTSDSQGKYLEVIPITYARLSGPPKIHGYRYKCVTLVGNGGQPNYDATAQEYTINYQVDGDNPSYWYYAKLNFGTPVNGGKIGNFGSRHKAGTTFVSRGTLDRINYGSQNEPAIQDFTFYFWASSDTTITPTFKVLDPDGYNRWTIGYGDIFEIVNVANGRVEFVPDGDSFNLAGGTQYYLRCRPNYYRRRGNSSTGE